MLSPNKLKTKCKAQINLNPSSKPQVPKKEKPKSAMRLKSSDKANKSINKQKARSGLRPKSFGLKKTNLGGRVREATSSQLTPKT